MPIKLLLIFIMLPVAGAWALSGLFIRMLFHPVQKKVIAGIGIQGIVPSIRDTMPPVISSAIHRYLDELPVKAMMDQNNAMDNMRPVIASHVDHFLKEKLKAAFPLLYQFMGEKTLGKFREAFLEEVDILLPDLLAQHGPALVKGFINEALIREKLAQIQLSTLEANFKKQYHRTIRSFTFFMVFAGLVLGAVQYLLYLFL